MPDNESRPTQDAPATAPVGGVAAAHGLTAPPAGGVLLAEELLPAGLFSSALGLEADVSGEFAELAPTFGDVLLAVGTGVADSQDALDKGLVQTAKLLSNTKIKVVTDVIQKLDDNGVPQANQTELITTDVALINYVSPTVHEWKTVRLSMDLSVGALDQERGMTFKKKQSSSSVEGYGLFWGFLGWFSTHDHESYSTVQQQSRQESDWATGQVRLDALLGPRTTGKFPVPATVAIGPQIFFSQGALKQTLDEGVVTSRSVDLVIKVLKADGSPNPNVNLVIDSDIFLHEFASSGDFTGSTTNPDGEVKVTITRHIPHPRFQAPLRRRVTAQLGSIQQSIEIGL
jgi:hypothetical protein